MTPRPIARSFTRAVDTVKVPKLNVKRVPKLSAAQRLQIENAPCEGCTGTCRKTRNRYFVVTGYDELDVETVKRCKFGVQRHVRRTIRSSKIPARYFGKTFDDYAVDKGNRDAVYYAAHFDEFNFGAYFYGECGTGKTFLASIIAQRVVASGRSCVFVKVPRLLDDIKATFDKGGELELLERIADVQLVVLDDFGMEKPTQWAGSTLCKILDMRYDNPRGKTIVTSNLSIDELADRLDHATDGNNLNGTRIADRLNELCKPILLQGVTRRL